MRNVTRKEKVREGGERVLGRVIRAIFFLPCASPFLFFGPFVAQIVTTALGRGERKILFGRLFYKLAYGCIFVVSCVEEEISDSFRLALSGRRRA